MRKITPSAQEVKRDDEGNRVATDGRIVKPVSMDEADLEKRVKHSS